MATGGSERSVDSRVVCSVCLEPYRGRQPKLLPCFHTFCLPCLSQLADTQVSSPATSGGEEKTEEQTSSATLSCPTCRNIIPIPPGGVAHFQANFYVDDDSSSPSPAVALSGAMATDEGVDEDDELTEKVKAQVKVLEAVLARLADEEEEITRQRREMDHTLQTRYAAGLRHLADTRDRCYESLRDTAQAAQDKLEAERALAESKLYSLSQLASQPTGLRKTQASATVLKDGALRHFQQLTQKTETKTYFSHNPSDSVIQSLVDSFAQFMGRVIPFGQTASDLTVRADIPPEGVATEYLDLLNNANIRHDVTALQTDVEKLRQELTTVQTEKTELQKDVAALQADNAKLRQDLFTETSRLTKDVRKLEADSDRLCATMATVKNDVSSLQAEQQKNATDVAAVQMDTGKLTKSLTSLQDLQAKAGERIAFHAEVDGGLWGWLKVTSGQTVILDTVVTNLGGGYDSRTGIFTAPLSGTYIFMAASRATNTSTAGFCICIESKKLGSSLSHKCDSSSTGHVVVDVTAGQRVWMESTHDEFCMGSYTYFSGALLQPKLH